MYFASLEEAFPEIDFDKSKYDTKIVDIPAVTVDTEPQQYYNQKKTFDYIPKENILSFCNNFDNHVRYCKDCQRRYYKSNDSMILILLLLLLVWIIYSKK